MTHLTFARRLLIALTLIAICVTIAESSKSRDRRHVGTEESSQRSGKTIYGSGSRSTKSSSSANNEITTESGRKVSHHLIGGHLRIDTKRQGDESLWDDGILMSGAGNGKEGKSARSGGGDDEDEKKTLSQQVKEGKYGLIQNEIYGDQPKRPGIISYLDNPEVPKDTADNLGGLDEEEIWLAENHVLVLRGGKFPEHEDGQQGSGDASPKWPPIDDYKAPRRQVKIPTRPRIPPPFPVQLTEGGPIQIIGPNGTTDVDYNGTLDYSADPDFTKGLLPGESPFFPTTQNGTLMDFGPPRNFSVEEKSSRGDNNEQKRPRPEAQPPSGFPPFYHAIPPGAVFVPPPGNQSDYDEEDQSIYYPPPYSFHYPQDNTTAVPPGPLVPGIILPPPPDFFSALDDKKTTTKKYTKRPTTTPPPRTRPTYLPPRKFTTKQYKSSSVLPTSVTKTTVLSTVSEKMSFGRTTAKNATNTYAPKQRTLPIREMTTVTSGKPGTLENTEMYTIGSVNSNQVSEATTQQKDWSTLVTGKTIPVLAYYPSTTQSSLERPVEVTPASIKSIITTGQPGRSSSHTSYYFYAESTDEDSRGTSKPSAVYYKTTTESPYYNVETRPRQAEQKKHYYAVETIAPVETPKDYKVKLIDSIVKNSQTFQYTDPAVTSSKFEANSPRGQSQRMLADQAPVYYQPASGGRPNHPLEIYYTTPKPQSYRSTAKPKPIYQYSFQIADYSKRGGNQGLYQHREEQQPLQQQNAPYSEYRGVEGGDRQYDYENIDSPSRQQPARKDASSFKLQHPVYSTSTSYSSVVETTPNPQHAYFTQQDEKLLDDVTKEYFTIFGKKLPDTGISSTTPIYGKSNSITERPEHNVGGYVSNIYKTGRPITYKTPNVNVHYGDHSQRPYSLKDDTLVNYRRPLPPINPDSEFIEVVEPKPRPQQQASLSNYELQPDNYRLPQNQARLQQHGPTPRYRVQGTMQPSSNRHTNNFVPLTESREELEEARGAPVSLLSDIEVNFRNPRPPINPDAEFIEPVQDNRSDNPNAYFAYRLPGDVGHFYFLTPQAVAQRQDPKSGYIYSKPRESRLLRRRRRPGDA